MALPTSRLQDQRYLGDGRSKLLHDLLHEDPTSRGCRIMDVLGSGQAVRFEPDGVKQAMTEEYTLCGKCFYGVERRRVEITRKFGDGA